MAQVHCLRVRLGCREPHFRNDVLSLRADDVEANVCDDPVRKRVYSLGKDFIPQERTLFPSYSPHTRAGGGDPFFVTW